MPECYNEPSKKQSYESNSARANHRDTTTPPRAKQKRALGTPRIFGYRGVRISDPVINSFLEMIIRSHINVLSQRKTVTPLASLSHRPKPCWRRVCRPIAQAEIATVAMRGWPQASEHREREPNATTAAFRFHQ